MAKENLEMVGTGDVAGGRESEAVTPGGLPGGGMPQGGTGERREPVTPEGRPTPGRQRPLGPDPEVDAKPARRRFTAEFKRRVLLEADRCTRSGEIGALLRRHGLYTSHLVVWRRQREEGALAGLAPKKRGRKPEPKNPLADRVAKLEREKAALEMRLKQAETIIEFQKKVSELLGIPLKGPGNEGSD